MKRRKFREETFIAIYEREEGELRIKDSLLIKGLLNLDDKEVFKILNRSCFSPERYQVKKEETLVTCMELHDSKFKGYYLPAKNTIRRCYGLYPLAD